MAITLGTPTLRGNGQPFQLWNVPVILDGTLVSASSLAHGIPGPPPFPPDAIIRLDGGTASANNMNVTLVSAGVSGTGISANTAFTLVLGGAGASNQVVNLGFLYFSQF